MKIEEVLRFKIIPFDMGSGFIIRSNFREVYLYYYKTNEGAFFDLFSQLRRT